MSLLHTPSPVIPMPHLRKGQIQLIFGPMFSGKTTELIRRCKRYQIANYKCVVVKYARDKRYAIDEVATHDEQKLAAINALALGEIQDVLRRFEVIGIDEGQFFPDLVEITEKLANEDKTVIVAALDGTFQREAFGGVLELVPKAEHVIKLTAVCMECFHDASFTKRKGNEKTIEVIGGRELYAAVCRGCHAGKTPRSRDASAQTPKKDASDDGKSPGLRSNPAKCKLDFDEPASCKMECDR